MPIVMMISSTFPIMLQEVLSRHPKITVTYFQQDERKAGGAYVSVTENVKKIDIYGQFLLMEGGVKIPLKEIFNMEGEIFGFVDDNLE